MTGTEYAPAVPGDVAEELGVTSLADLDEHADEFGRKIYGIEAGSPGNETIQAAIDADAYGLGDWELVASGTPAMLAQVSKSHKAGEPIVFLAWSPHWMTVEFDTVFLEDPEEVWGGAGEIRTVTRAGFADDNPEINEFLGNLTFTTDQAGEFYYAHDKDGEELSDIAAAWIEANPDSRRVLPRGRRRRRGRAGGRGVRVVTTDVDTVAQPTHRATEQPAIEGRGLSKVYGLGDRQAARALRADDPAAAVAAAGGYLGAADVELHHRHGRDVRRHGPLRLRQVDRAPDDQPAQRADRRRAADRRRGHHARSTTALREIRNSRIGMVFQHFSLFPHRTVRDNAAYGLKVRGVGRAERCERADAALERVGLGDRGDASRTSSPGACSSGSDSPARWRSTPPVLLMDEPFSRARPADPPRHAGPARSSCRPRTGGPSCSSRTTSTRRCGSATG